MLVVLLTAALLVLSSAQNTEGDVTNTDASDGETESVSNQQTQNSDADSSSTDINAGNDQGDESLPLASEEASSANSANDQEQQETQAENQVNSDSAENNPENQPEAVNVEEVENSHPSSPDNSQSLPKERKPKKKYFANTLKRSNRLGAHERIRNLSEYKKERRQRIPLSI